MGIILKWFLYFFRPTYKLRAKKGKYETNSTKAKTSINEESLKASRVRLNQTLPHRVSSFLDEENNRMEKQVIGRPSHHPKLNCLSKNTENLEKTVKLHALLHQSPILCSTRPETSNPQELSLKDLKITFEPYYNKNDGQLAEGLSNKYEKQQPELGTLNEKFCLPNMIYFKLMEQRGRNHSNSNKTVRFDNRVDACTSDVEPFDRRKSLGSFRNYIIT